MSSAAKLFLARLRPTFKDWGFALLPGGAGFIRRREFGFEKVSWGSFTRGDQSFISLGLGIRHDQVDDLVNALGHIWGEANQKATTTVYRGLEIFPFDSTLSLIIIDKQRLEADVEVAASQVEAMMRVSGLAFLERYNSVLECSRDLNEPIDLRAHPLCNGFPLRAYYGLGAAAVAEPERVPALLEEYSTFVSSARIVDPLAYDVGKGLAGQEAILFRMREIAARAGH